MARRSFLRITMTICIDHTRIAPTDFHLFLKLKEFLGGKRFGSDEELENVVIIWLNELAAEEYDMGILKHVDRYDRCCKCRREFSEASVLVVCITLSMLFILKLCIYNSITVGAEKAQLKNTVRSPKLNFFGDFSPNMVFMAVVLNQQFGESWDGWRGVAALGERPHLVLKSYRTVLKNNSSVLK
ncbi:hypothetical protein AVEN_80402-1 [Araneus ventricosus]|uniref:Histone-lysine N-methyltransferase SETMAR n=1 Tax=Araneus ventricosus TaxID=182803 RepID=A0A4Y2K631_ARAVE|nr:hypothetical protein AVEN_80402-1 [Araneus ventricosus]